MGTTQKLKAVPPEWYWENRGYQARHYSKSKWFPSCEVAHKMVMKVKNPFVLDVGCGSGHFAHILFDRGFNMVNYIGVDFCSQLIDLARENVDTDFRVGDIMDPKLYAEPFNVFVALELLEHIEDDLGLLKMVPSGTDVVITGTKAGWWESHLRSFRNQKDFEDRYSDLIQFKEATEFYRTIVSMGVRR